MSKKENLSIIRPNDFESIDDELTQAMVHLEESNTRVLDVLTAETEDEESAEPSGVVRDPETETPDPPTREGPATKEEDREQGN